MFQFTGDWEFTYYLKAFEGFQNRIEFYHSKQSEIKDKNVVILINEVENNDPDPTSEQINSINYLIENQFVISNLLLEGLKLNYPKLQERYNEVDDEFPNLSSFENFKKRFRILNIHILIPSKNNFSYMGFEFDCPWDGEHGLGFLLNKDEIIKIGSGDTAFDSYEAMRDSGILEKYLEELQSKKQNFVLKEPNYYKPHPKYNKLKPYQIRENECYESRLIGWGFTNKFKEVINSGLRTNVYSKNGELSYRGFLKSAFQVKNWDLVNFLEPYIDNFEGLIGDFNKSKEVIEFLVGKGVSINEMNMYRKNILEQNVFDLRYKIEQKDLSSKHRESYTTDFIQDVENIKQHIVWLIQKGAVLENERALSMIQHNTIEVENELAEFITNHFLTV